MSVAERIILRRLVAGPGGDENGELFDQVVFLAVAVRDPMMMRTPRCRMAGDRLPAPVFSAAGGIELYHADNLRILTALPDDSVDSIVTDPPYEMSFMGRRWDSSGVAYDVDRWAQCLGILKPGGHLVAFGGTRTYHRLVCAVEDAGFEIRDQIDWLYGTGMPKGIDVSKAIDKAAGAERADNGPGQWARQRPNWSRMAGYAGQPYTASPRATLPATTEAAQWGGTRRFGLAMSRSCWRVNHFQSGASALTFSAGARVPSISTDVGSPRRS